MKDIPLTEYVELHGQGETARRLGITQGAVWQMLRANRQIYVKEALTVEAYEVKPIGRPAPVNASAE